ncbi:MAG: PG0541 family transporter-associated protein [Balneolaceae bacterium]
MKSVLITCNMILSDEVLELLDHLDLRGYTRWDDVKGRGSNKGEPHLGSHIWPALNSAFMVILPEEKVDPLFDGIKTIEEGGSQQGIRAFVWGVERMI